MVLRCLEACFPAVETVRCRTTTSACHWQSPSKRGPSAEIVVSESVKGKELGTRSNLETISFRAERCWICDRPGCSLCLAPSPSLSLSLSLSFSSSLSLPLFFSLFLFLSLSLCLFLSRSLSLVRLQSHAQLSEKAFAAGSSPSGSPGLRRSPEGSKRTRPSENSAHPLHKTLHCPTDLGYIPSCG